MAAKKKTAKKKTAKKKTAARMAPRRADYGAPIGHFIDKQPPHLRVILEELRMLVEEVAPEAEASLKWGMPFFCIGGHMMCAIGGHKAHVNLIMVAPPKGFDDPDGRLAGDGKGGRHLKLRSLDELPRAAVRRWLRVALKHAHATVRARQ